MASPFKKLHYRQAREMLGEAGKLYVRSWRLKRNNDFSGCVEASQHSGELAVKSLYKMVGLDPPKTHDPGRDLNKVLTRLKKLSENQEDFGDVSLLIRLEFLSNILERFHNEGLYGYKGVQASKIFNETDAEYIMQCSLELVLSSGFILLLFGYRNEFLPKEEEQAIESLSTFITGNQIS